MRARRALFRALFTLSIILVAVAESAHAAVAPGLIAFRQSGVGVYTVEPGLPATLDLIYPGAAAYPTWQPGGLVLAVARADPPFYLTSSIVLINRQGQELKTVLSGAHLWALDFSPDGKKIAYVCQ